jgi:hypothetical protein
MAEVARRSRDTGFVPGPTRYPRLTDCRSMPTPWESPASRRVRASDRQCVHRAPLVHAQMRPHLPEPCGARLRPSCRHRPRTFATTTKKGNAVRWAMRRPARSTMYHVSTSGSPELPATTCSLLNGALKRLTNWGLLMQWPTSARQYPQELS